jgi:hypothetical protein
MRPLPCSARLDGARNARFSVGMGRDKSAFQGRCARRASGGSRVLVESRRRFMAIMLAMRVPKCVRGPRAAVSDRLEAAKRNTGSVDGRIIY